MNKRFGLLIGIAAVLMAAFVAIPAYGQVKVEDLNYQAPNKAIEPGDATVMDDTTVPATLGSGVVIMKFKVTDLDPQADDPSDVTITEFSIENLGTATDLDIVEIMCMDQDNNAVAPVAVPAPGPNPNIPFTAVCDVGAFVIPDNGEETFQIAVRTADTTTLTDDSQRHTLVLRVTVRYEETVGSPPTPTEFTAVVTDGASEFVWNGGLNSFTDDTYIVNPLMPGQQGVVSRFTVCDSDSNEHNLVIDELLIRQGDGGTALFTDISTIKIFRVENNTRTMLGTLTPDAAFDRGGGTDGLLLPTSVFLLDDHCTTFEVEAQVSPFAFKGKLIQLEFQLSTEEPVFTAIDPSVDPEIQTRASTVIGKGLISIPDAVIIGPSANIRLNVQGIPLPGLGTLQVGPSGAFTYDPSVIQVKEIVGVGNYTVEATVIDNRRGEARFTVRVDPAQAANALQTGTIAILKVERALNSRPGQRSRLGLIFDQVTDAFNVPLTGDVGVSVGEIKIVPGGDINGDGVTTISDALLLATEILNGCPTLTDEQRLIADVAGTTANGDKAPVGKIPTCTASEASASNTDPRFEHDAKVDLTSADVAEIAKLALTNPTGASVNRPVQVVPLRVQSVLTAARSGGFEIQALGSGIANIEVKVFNLAGNQLVSQESVGNRLWLRMQDASGRPLANGVYLYVVTVKGTNGEAVRSEVRKLVVLR